MVPSLKLIGVFLILLLLLIPLLIVAGAQGKCVFLLSFPFTFPVPVASDSEQGGTDDSVALRERASFPKVSPRLLQALFFSAFYADF